MCACNCTTNLSIFYTTSVLLNYFTRQIFNFRNSWNVMFWLNTVRTLVSKIKFWLMATSGKGSVLMKQAQWPAQEALDAHSLSQSPWGTMIIDTVRITATITTETNYKKYFACRDLSFVAYFLCNTWVSPHFHHLCYSLRSGKYCHC